MPPMATLRVFIRHALMTAAAASMAAMTLYPLVTNAAFVASGSKSPAVLTPEERLLATAAGAVRLSPTVPPATSA